MTRTSAIISPKIQARDCRENSFKKLIAGSGYYAMMESNFLATAVAKAPFAETPA